MRPLPSGYVWSLRYIRCTPLSGLIVIWNHWENSNNTIYHLCYALWWILQCHDWLDVDEGLWSILSRFPAVKSLCIRVAEQTQPSFSYLSIAVLASSVESCKALSYDTDSPLSNKLSMRYPVCVFCFGWAGRDTMDELSRSRLCLTATESALLCLMALNTSSCGVAAGLISKS